MRKIVLTLVMAALVCMPVLAQRFGGGMMGRGDTGAMLLGIAGVQKELKLTDDQKADIEKAGKDRQAAFTKAREDMDQDLAKTAMEDHTKAIAKIKASLKPEQKKRLLGIEIQLAEKSKTASIFKNEEVVKALKLDDKQKDSIKELLSENEKDAKELFEDAKGDRSKMKGTFEKVQKMGAEVYTKVTKSLTEKQLEAWKELQGEKFEVEMPSFNPKGKGKGKNAPKKKTDDL